MTYTQQGDRVMLEMTRDDYNQLAIILGYAMGSALAQDEKQFAYNILRFTNELNNGNPNFTPYTFPEEYQR